MNPQCNHCVDTGGCCSARQTNLTPITRKQHVVMCPLRQVILDTQQGLSRPQQGTMLQPQQHNRQCQNF
jgi:hypothetical protein